MTDLSQANVSIPHSSLPVTEANRRATPAREWTGDDSLHRIDRDHHDACALICAVRKGGQATHGNVKRTIESLARMGHRTGYINGEGDGVGIMTDIPRQLWIKRLSLRGMSSSIIADRGFWVAHVMIPSQDRQRARPIVQRICHAINAAGLQVVYEEAGEVNRHILGPNAEKNEPDFWQIAGQRGSVGHDQVEKTVFRLQVQLEEELGVHFASFSSNSVVYKVQGTIEILRRYYPELRDPDYASTVTMGHARYSTNTNPIFERAQPFHIIGHNGEFNTISRLRLEAQMAGLAIHEFGSDSQDVDRVIHGLMAQYDLDLIEAMEHIFPPYSHDLLQNEPDIHQMYQTIRQSFGHFAQGPAAVAARFGTQLMFSVDALGLRPLWFGETEKEYFASSERGVYPPDVLASTPRPLAPGQKIALQITPGVGVEVIDYPGIQQHVYLRHLQRNGRETFRQPPVYHGIDNAGSGTPFITPDLQPDSAASRVATSAPAAVMLADAAPAPVVVESAYPAASSHPWQREEFTVNTASMSALGWERYHLSVVETMAQRGKEEIGSLGWDGPLAALSNNRSNLADYFKETVAVVTNPAIDREREQSQFTTQVIIGARPAIGQVPDYEELLVQLETPLLLGGYPDLGPEDVLTQVAADNGTLTIEALLDMFASTVHTIAMCTDADESHEQAIARIQQDALEAVIHGARCILLDDLAAFTGEQRWIDPLLVTAAVDKILRTSDSATNRRRQAGIVVRSGSLRDLHDIVLILSMGANAVNPYALFAVALGIAPKGSSLELEDEAVYTALDHTVGTLTRGIQKVTSTVGCHELRGYGHSFSSIGLATSIARILGTPNYFGSDAVGLTWGALSEDGEARAAEFRGDVRARLQNPDRFYPKMWKKVEAVAQGEMGLDEYTEALRELEEKIPVEIRHVLDIRESSNPASPEEVDLRVKTHDLPLIISAMSYGSQGELAYRTYGEAAKLLNIICVNGEGGEMADVMGKYPDNRGQQVASARFGVNIGFLNSCNLIEIKIGQGAKPGEGGHLPGFKVTEQVAASRGTVPGVALISPSNNHDLYSIEDLAQLIDELKTANPNARVSVKLPVVPGIGIIAVGVAKAGADVITVTGYTGGTGAARAHALRHVGLPTEIGVWLAHRTLVESGLRKEVEIWADGGMKSGRDAVKMMLLGANRVGFGTLAMVSVGCTICRGCQDGTCHVGITTHVKTTEEAGLKGFKAFRPFHEKGSAQGIVNTFCMLADDMRREIARLGYTSAQDIVGHAELLTQTGRHDQIDLTTLLKPVPHAMIKPAQPGGRRITRPRNTVSRQISEVVGEYVAKGEYELTYDDEQVMAMDRALGTHLCGAIKRGDIPNADQIHAINLSFSNSALPGNGLGAFNDEPVNILVEGGAQDGVAKCARGGRITILKGLNHNGARLDGSVGKSFAYGAQKGLFIVQGDADTRACIRMSGADAIFGGLVRQPLRDELGGIGARANLKGYAFEYMTSGRALVLGDPGPWICAGMTGGIVYQRLQPQMGLNEEAIQRRLAPGATIDIQPIDETAAEDIRELLQVYIQTLELNNQPEATETLYVLLAQPDKHFVKLTPTTTG